MPKYTDLTVEEISFVDEGDNKNADIIFYKTKEPTVAEEMKKEISQEELKDMIDKLQSMYEAIMQIADVIGPEIEEPDSEDTEATEATEATKEDDDSEDEEKTEKSAAKTTEEVEVSKEVTDLQKELSEKNDIISEFVEKSTVEKFEKEAEAYSNLPIESKDLAKSLRAINSLDNKDAILDMFKALNEQSATSDLFKKFGASGESANNDEGKLVGIAKQIQNEEKVTYAKAYTIALERNPELYKGAK